MTAKEIRQKFLDYSPQGKPTVDNYFLNDDQANNAIDIVYYRLFERDGMFSRDIYWEQGCANDMVWGIWSPALASFLWFREY